MKAKVLKLCSLLMALLVMTSLLAACGGGDENPFLGDWDDDAGEQSLIFLEDGTGAQTSYYGAIEFTRYAGAVFSSGDLNANNNAPLYEKQGGEQIWTIIFKTHSLTIRRWKTCESA